MRIAGWFGLLFGLLICQDLQAADPQIECQSSDTTVTVQVNAVETLRYVFRDPQVSRPYFAPVRTLTGQQVSRNHLPQDKSDTTDHPGLHTGIWLSFGDLSGHDYWRLKAKTKHVRFVEAPTVSANIARWTVLNRYLSTDGQQTVCEETARYVVRPVAQGYLLELLSEFRPDKQEIVFGDQEEMGLGIRLNTPLAVDQKLGGRILDNRGRRNGTEVWGQTADWCDYSGPLDGRWVGMTVFSDSSNVRPSWSHARDYGFLAVNPFGRAAFTQGEPSRIVIQPGETFRLRFGVYVHESASDADCPVAEIYRVFADHTPTAAPSP